MVITEIGEVGVDVDGASFVLRPSLYSMTKIGDPSEIVRVYASVMGAHHDEQLQDCIIAIYACCDEDVTKAFGSYNVDENGTLRYERGAATVEDVVAIARHLMLHGVVGKLEPLKRDGGAREYTTKFEAKAHAAVAVAHLGIQSREAWGMTMTELAGALRAKFPPEKSVDVPSKEELQDTLDWHDAVLAAREKQAQEKS